MNGNHQDDLEDAFTGDVLAQEQSTVDHDQHKLGDQHDKEWDWDLKPPSPTLTMPSSMGLGSETTITNIDHAVINGIGI